MNMETKYPKYEVKNLMNIDDEDILTMKQRTANHPIMIHSIQLLIDLIGGNNNDSSLQIGFNFNQTID